MKRHLKVVLIITMALGITISMIGCSPNEEVSPKTEVENSKRIENVEKPTTNAPTEPEIKKVKQKQRIEFKIKKFGSFVVELYPDHAPKTCENFVNLVNQGFYNGLTFHRNVYGYLIQGGDPNGNGTGGSEKKIKGEFKENGFAQNTLKHKKGIISMARSSENDSASSQFFICVSKISGLDGKYAAFGKVVKGMDTVLKMARTEVMGENFVERPIIKSAKLI